MSLRNLPRAFAHCIEYPSACPVYRKIVCNECVHYRDKPHRGGLAR